MQPELVEMQGKICRVEPAACRFELLTETAFDPQTQEGRSRHAVDWTGQARFTKVVTQNSFAGIHGDRLAYIHELNDENANAAAAGNDFVALKVTILAAAETGTGWKTDRHNFVVPFRADPTRENPRAGTVELNGKPVGIRLRGPRAEVEIRTVANADEIGRGFWTATIRGDYRDGRFVAESLEIFPQVDPREVDDPKLPRILVIGDSISMNYHDAAKAALQGVANYYRIDGNGGDSRRGVVCAALWLGDFTQPGLHWDVIQFNHGLHDLRQVYDQVAGTFGAYQVPVAEYQVNLEREIQILKRTGANLVWCSTTPVPNNSIGTFSRRKDEDLIFNRAARGVVAKHPEILINDLNRAIRESAAFDQWRQAADVHFWDAQQQAALGRLVADGVVAAVEKRRLLMSKSADT